VTQPFCYTRNAAKFPRSTGTRVLINKGARGAVRRDPFRGLSPRKQPLIMVQIMQYAIYGRSQGAKHVIQGTGGGEESKNKTNRGEKRPLDDPGCPTFKHDAPPKARWGPRGMSRLS
jgi:hypothetical protein